MSALTSKNAELESSNTAIQKRMADVLKDMEDKDAKFRYLLSQFRNLNLEILFWGHVSVSTRGVYREVISAL